MFRGAGYCLLAILCIVVCGCNRKSIVVSREDVMVDSLMLIYQSNLAIEPRETRQLIIENQKSVKDSINYYRLSAIIAICYWLDNKADSAIITNKAVLRFCSRRDKTNQRIALVEVKANNDLGAFWQYLGHTDSAIYYLHKAVGVISQTNNKDKLPDIYINLASDYRNKGDFAAAAGTYRRALFVADSLKQNMVLNDIYAGLGTVYTDLRNYELANYYYSKVEEVFDTIPAYEQYFFANSRGNYYFKKGEHDKLLPWFFRANAVSKSFELSGLEATTEANIAESYLLFGQTDSAKYYLDKCAGCFLAPDAPAAHAFYMKGLYAALYLQTGDLVGAERLLSEPYDKTAINPEYIYLNHKRFEELYRKRGDYRKAYEFREKADAINDSIRNITVQNNIAEIDMRYRQDTTLMRKDIIIARNEQEVLRLKNVNTSVIAVLVVGIVLVSGGVVYTRKRRELQHARQVATVNKLRMESVRNRISPHFMFNVLNSVIPGLREHEQLVRPMELLVQSVRGNLMASDKIAVSLKEEIAIVKNFLELLSSIGSDVPRVEWNIAPNVDMKTLLPSMIIQIPVENAVKYAFESDNPDKLLKINIEDKTSVLHLEVEDNGVGFRPGRLRDSSKGTGSGLKILYKTVELLNVRNQRKLEFDIRDKTHISADLRGTIVMVRVPQNFNYDL